MNSPRFFLILFLFSLFSCINYKHTDDIAAHPKIKKWYEESIADAAYPSENEVSYILTPLRKDNPQLIWKEIEGEQYVLAVSWKADKQYYKNDEQTGFYNTSRFPIWVTLAPYAQEMCRDEAFGKREGLDLRLKQLFGLPPNTAQKWFVEFWVRPADLFRPCPDAEVSDNHCDTYFPDGTTDEHKAWINANRVGSYYGQELYQRYPWTQLGYTYDWNRKNKTNVGLSEFVIGPDRNVVIRDSYTTAAYCGK